MNKVVRRKRLILINRDFQLRYAGSAVIVGLSSTFLTGILILYPLYKFEILRIAQFVPVPIISVMILAAIANVLMIGIVGVYITHRIAGPVFSLVRCFRDVEEGFWGSKLKTRDGDDLEYVVRNYNAMIDAIRNASLKDITTLANIKAQLEAAQVEGAQLQVEELLDRIEGRVASSKQTNAAGIAS